MMGQNSSKWYRNTQFFLIWSKKWVFIFILTIFFFQIIFCGPPKMENTGKKAVIEKTGKVAETVPEHGKKVWEW